MIDTWAANYSMSEKRALERAFWTHHLGNYAAQQIAFGLKKPPIELISEWNSFRVRIARGEPFQHILGMVSFSGCNLKVNKHVLIPRPETELLVQETVKKIGDSGKLLDIGTGSGAIALGLKKQCPNWSAYACDVSKEALDICNHNAAANQLNINCYYFDVCDASPLPNAPYDLIISNPPYIPQNLMTEMDDVVVKHEPALALFVPEKQPFLFYEHIVNLSKNALAANGWIAFETHFDGAKGVANMLNNRIFTNIEIITDYDGYERFVFARKRH